MIVSTDPEDVLVTYSLGSCVGVAFYDSSAKVGGLVHCMLPLSKIDPSKAKDRPCMFTDTGIATILQALFDLGAKRKNLLVRVAGAASLLDKNGHFKIGERNYTVLRKILWKNNLLIKSEEVKGTASRTVYLHMDTGRTVIKSGGREMTLE